MIGLKFFHLCFRVLWFVLPALFMLSCEKAKMEDGRFLPPTRHYDMAIEGGINTQGSINALGSPQYIRLMQPATHPDSLPKPISKATVVVNDSKADIVFREVSPGVYRAFISSGFNYNQAYTLKIRYGTKEYTAVDTLRQLVNIGDDFLPVSTKVIPGDSVRIVVPKHTFGYLNAAKWMIMGSFPIWSPGNFEQAQYYSYTHRLGSPNSLYPLQNLRRSFNVAANANVFIAKISLSEGYSKYLYSVFMETDWSGLFSGVPVNVQSNVSGNVQGYFSVVDVETRSYKGRELL